MQEYKMTLCAACVQQMSDGDPADRDSRRETWHKEHPHLTICAPSTEPHYSGTPCDYCGEWLAGDRYETVALESVIK